MIDTCLVGSWKQTGGGGEWMRQNLKMAQPTAAPSDGTLTFNADGTFSTSKVDSKAEVTAPGTSTRATGQMNAQASGTWSAAGGTLTLCMTSVDSKGSIEIEEDGGYAADEARQHVDGLFLRRRHAVDHPADAQEHHDDTLRARALIAERLAERADAEG